MVQPPLLPEPIEIVEQGLRPAHGKGGNNQISAPIHRVLDDFQECRFLVINLVQAVSIGGLHNQIIRPMDRCRILQNRLMGLPKVTRKDQLGRLPILCHKDFENGGTHDMPRVLEYNLHILPYGNALPIENG